MRSWSRGGLLGLVLVITIIGVWTRDARVLSLLLPLIVLTLLVVLIARDAGANIVATWEGPQETRFLEGERVMLTLRLRNDGNGGGLVRYQVSLPEALGLDVGRSSFPLTLAPGEEISIPFILEARRRGHHIIGPITIGWDDLLLFQRSHRELGARKEIWITPAFERIDRCDLRSHKVRPSLGNVRSRLLGEGMGFHSIRDYQPLDGLKRINWKASGRRGGLLVNEHETERSGDVVIVVDARHEAGGRGQRGELIDWGLRAATSLSAFYLGQRDRVGLMVISDYIGLVRPGSGRRQFHRIMESLTETRTGDERSMISVRLAMQRFFSPQSLIVYITPLEDPGTVQGILELCHRGYQVAVVAPRLDDEGDSTADILSHRMEAVRRDDLVYLLRRVCLVVDWDVRRPLSEHLIRGRGWDRWN